MVLKHRELKMSSEQPVKKKPRKGDESVDETDFIHNLADNGILPTLHLNLPSTINEADINGVNSQLNGNFNEVCVQTGNSYFLASKEGNSSSVNNLEATVTNHDRHELDAFQEALIRQCLCGVSENLLRQPFERQKLANYAGNGALLTWPINELLQLLSNLQLLFDVYLKQNNKGYICARIVDICNALVRNEYNLIEQLLTLVDLRNRYVNYLLVRIISSFLIIAKTNVNNEWLDAIGDCLSLDYVDYDKINFGLEVMKRVVEWKDVEIHVLEETHSSRDGASTSQEVDFTTVVDCATVQYSDSESFDTSSIKETIIKCLKLKWPYLINRIQSLIESNDSVESQTCILAFLSLWESTISVKANLSVIDTKLFYMDLENFASLLLNSNMQPILWKQLLSLFNEILCYGSTLALQDMLPDDTCKLAYTIVRYIKDSRILGNLPFKCSDGYIVHSFIGTIPTCQSVQTQIDKTLLQKMILLVLKSVAVTAKEIRTDSSDSSVGSEDSEYNQDMRVIERSVRTVLEKLDFFIKRNLSFHPETHFSKTLIHLFSDQDDYMIESMVCTLDVTVGISNLADMLNPVYAFVEFLRIVSHDSDVLLDYLVSNETCFLLYLLRFLKYIKRDWSNFVNSCESAGGNELSNTMTVLIRLNMQIERLVSKDLFPYNISPILELFKHCESLYESTS